MPRTIASFFAPLASSLPPRHLAFRTKSCRATAALGGLLATSLLLSGCQAPPAATGPTDLLLHIPDRESFLDASLSLLRRYDFPPEHVDRARGKIVTDRTTSGQWFEPWRVDSQGPYQTLESSLHTIGRVVTVTVEPAAGPTGAGGELVPPGTDDRYRVTVHVEKSRYSAPERQITTASGALGIYSERIPTTEGLRRARSQSAHWVPLGRDPLLEAYLLAKLADATPDVELVQQ